MVPTLKDFPIIKPAQIPALQDSHNKVRGTPPASLQHLNYSLLLPKSWGAEKDLGQLDVGIGELTKIGLFVEGAMPDPAIVQVFACNLPLEVEPSDWARFQTEKVGAQVLFCRNIDCAAGRAVDVGATLGSDKNQYVMRNLVFTDSARIMMISALVINHRYPALLNDLAIATNSFALQQPTGSSKLEQWISARGSAPNFIVAYPMSWNERPAPSPPPGKSGLELFLAKDQQMLAYVRVKATDNAQFPNQSPDDQLVAATHEFQKAGIQLTTAWGADTDPALSEIPDIASNFICTGSLNDNPVELRLSLFKRAQIDFAVSSLSVPREKDAMLWMRTKRAHHITLLTAQPA